MKAEAFEKEFLSLSEEDQVRVLGISHQKDPPQTPMGCLTRKLPSQEKLRIGCNFDRDEDNILVCEPKTGSDRSN